MPTSATMMCTGCLREAVEVVLARKQVWPAQLPSPEVPAQTRQSLRRPNCSAACRVTEPTVLPGCITVCGSKPAKGCSQLSGSELTHQHSEQTSVASEYSILSLQAVQGLQDIVIVTWVGHCSRTSAAWTQHAR